MVFADSSARTTALSGVLAEGMMSYLQDTNTVEVYDGSSWVSVGNTGDITGVTAGTGLTGGGTSGTVTLTNDMATTITAKGDLLVGTGSATYDNLAVGTDGYTLVADSGETTGLKWAAPAVDTNGFVYVGGATFTTVSSFSFANNTFTSSYKNYKIFVYFTAYTTASDLTIRCRTAGSDFTSGNYFYGTARQPYSGSYTATNGSAETAWKIGLNDYYDRSAVEFTYYDPKGAGDRMTFTGMVDNIGGAFGGLYQNGTSNVDALTFAKASGNMSGFYRVYGLKDS
jgi:hypothetical protein